MECCYRRLPLTGLTNARDLGGYPAKNGGLTKYRVFIRSEAPKNLTESDLIFLKGYGVRTAVDFRGDREISREPSCLKDVGWIRYLRSPTFNEQVAFATRGAASGGPPVTSFVDWGEKYIEMAEDCRDWVRETIEFLAGGAGAVIFNCTTGKDRTGLISALLLGLAGVSEGDIVADYCVSQVYLTKIYEELRAAFLQHWPEEEVRLTDPFFKTDPDNMRRLLEHLNNNYGGIDAYAVACGISEETTEAIRRKLIQNQ